MARRPVDRLSARSVQSITKPGRHADGKGLYLQVDDSGAKRWVFVFQWRKARREMGLGSVDLVSLKEAREERDKARRLVFEGKDPIEERRKAKAPPALVPTFAEMVETVAPTIGLKSQALLDRWKRTITRDMPSLQRLRVDAIETSHVIAALQPHWTRIPETASRMRGRVERVLDAARAAGHIQDPWQNPARWKGHLKLLLPKAKRATQHRKALPYRELPAFMAELRTHQGVGAAALEWTILTAARTDETRFMPRAELRPVERLWIVPGSRMKEGREHRVPLSAAAEAVLAKVEGIGGTGPEALVFPGAKKGRPISNMTMSKALKTIGVDATVHGFRSTFKDWAEDCTNFQSGVIEAALAHLVGDETERAYRRGDALEKRRLLMDAWANYCNSAGGENVVPLSRPR